MLQQYIGLGLITLGIVLLFLLPNIVASIRSDIRQYKKRGQS